MLPALLEAGAGAVEVVDCSSSPTAYAAHFVSWWAAGPVLVVEHDVEVRPGTLQRFAECPLPWCCSPYGSEALLGCTRFRPAELPAIPIQELAGVHWQALDMALYRMLLDRGARPHKHLPPPRHHHGWQRA